MQNEEKDLGTISVLLKRLNEERIPHILAIKDRVDAGHLLSDADIAYLEKAIEDARLASSLVHRHPEYHDLAARILGLYKEITDRALENEKSAI